MSEQELTPDETLAALFGKPKPEGNGEPSKPTRASEPEPVELTEDEAELARRYGLAPEDVKRVRGDTWAERCEDAERLAAQAEPQSIADRAKRKLREMQGNPNAAELAALAINSAKNRELASRLHPQAENEDAK